MANNGRTPDFSATRQIEGRVRQLLWRRTRGGFANLFGEGSGYVEDLSMSYWIYVLKSDQDNSYYVGSTQDVSERLVLHNKGQYQYTKGLRPWRVIYQEAYDSRSKAVQRERFLKSGQGRRVLRRLISG